MILISEQLLSRICQQAVAAYPEECCGILVGTGDGKKQIQRFCKTANMNKQRLRERYLIDAFEHYNIDKQARADGLSIVGFYHSHPDSPPYPSEFDIKSAWPAYSYIIISVDKHKNTEAKSWILAGRNRCLVAEEIRYLRIS